MIITNETVTLDIASVVRETEKARLINTGMKNMAGNTIECWVAKSASTLDGLTLTMQWNHFESDILFKMSRPDRRPILDMHDDAVSADYNRLMGLEN